MRARSSVVQHRNWKKTGEAGARLCATRPWVYPAALISLHPFEWKFSGALLIHSYVT